MTDSGENTAAPPEKPFYADRPSIQRVSWGGKASAEYLAMRRAYLEEELKKPVKERAGKLRVKQDFSEEELKAMEKMYGRKR